MQLRFLQTLTEVATERSSIVVFPVPIDLLEAFRKYGASGGMATEGSS